MKHKKEKNFFELIRKHFKQKTNLTEEDKKIRRRKIFRLSISALLILVVFGGIFLALFLTGTFDKVDSAEELKVIIEQAGIYSRLIFVLLQFLQVTFLPLPAIITTIAGTLVFGAWQTLIMSYIAIMAGSIFAFWLGRKFGTKILYWAVGEEDTKKWKAILTEGKYAFFLMMLFPVFPDDVLCMVAGVTNMTYKFFIVTNLITRLLSIAMTCFFGAGDIIPYNTWWGLAIWAGLILLLVFAFLIVTKNQNKIEAYIQNINDKLTKKDNKISVKTSENKIVK